MTEVKYLEVRDSGTFIPAMAIRLRPRSEPERWLLARAGYGRTPKEQSDYVLLCRIDGGEGEVRCDPYSWPGGARTMPTAHAWLVEHFDNITSGDVICVEYILGERAEPKRSERESQQSNDSQPRRRNEA